MPKTKSKSGTVKKNTIKEYDEKHGEKEEPQKISADIVRDGHYGCLGEIQESGDR